MRAFPTMTTNQVVLTWLLMAAQGCRRLYECIALTKPSEAKMPTPAWLLGNAFYLAVGIAVWVEGIREDNIMWFCSFA